MGAAACGSGGLAHRHHDRPRSCRRGADEEHPAAFVADRVAVRDVAWAEGVVAGADLERLVADLDRGGALEDRRTPRPRGDGRAAAPRSRAARSSRRWSSGRRCRPPSPGSRRGRRTTSVPLPRLSERRSAPAWVWSARSLLLLGLVVDGQKRDRVAPGAVARRGARHSCPAPRAPARRRLPGRRVGGRRRTCGRAPRGRRRPGDLSVPARLPERRRTSRARASNNAASASGSRSTNASSNSASSSSGVRAPCLTSETLRRRDRAAYSRNLVFATASVRPILRS